MGERARPGLVALAVLLSGACGSGAGGSAAAVAAARAAQARQVALQAGLPGQVADFFAAAAGGASATFTVDYDLGPAGRSHVAQAPPRRRIDVITPDGTETSVFVLATGTSTCRRIGSSWTCAAGGTAPPLGPFTPEALQAAIAALAGSVGSYRFEVDTRRVAGTRASCLVTTPLAASAPAGQVLCVSPSGVVLLALGTAQPVTALSYRTTASASEFRLPARPS